MDKPLSVERRVVVKGTCPEFSGSYPNGGRRDFTEYHNYYEGCLDYWRKRLDKTPERSFQPDITEIYVEQRYTTPWTTIDANTID